MTSPECQDWFLIFDMDGVIIDSNPFHKTAWKAFCEKHSCSLTNDELQQYVYGKTNEDALRHVFGNDLTTTQINEYAQQKEETYRELFKPHLTALPGLAVFLEKAKSMFAELAVATSAPPENVDFVMDTLNLRRFFSIIVDETQVTKGKPDPEIYLKTAKLLQANPKQCIVFEDSLSGIQAAKNAGMVVIGVTTTHSAEELADKVDATIEDFNNVLSAISKATNQKLQSV